MMVIAFVFLGTTVVHTRPSGGGSRVWKNSILVLVLRGLEGKRDKGEEDLKGVKDVANGVKVIMSRENGHLCEVIR